MRVLRLAVSLFLAMSASARTFPLAEPRIGFPRGGRSGVAVAASEDQYLAVWRDMRERLDQKGRTWAARISRDGEVLDPVGIAIGSFDAKYLSQDRRAVASDGSDFLIVTAREDQPIEVTKVTRGGIAAPTRALDAAASHVSLVWLGDVYALLYTTWYEYGTPQPRAARAQLLDRDGNDAGEPWDIVTGTAPIRELNAAVTADGMTTLLTWIDDADRRMHASSVGTASIRDRSQRITSTPAAPAEGWIAGVGVASGGDVFFVVLQGESELWGRVLDRNGTPLTPIISISPVRGGASAAVTWSGSRFVVVSNVVQALGDFVGVSEFSASGERLGEQIMPTYAQGSVGAAAIGPDALVVWPEERYSGRRLIRADLLDSSSTLRFGSEPLVVSRASAFRTAPSGVWLGRTLLATWREYSSSVHVAAGRFSLDGRPLDGAGQVISESASIPSVAANGRDALIGWTKFPTAYVTHARADGAMTTRSLGVEGGENVDVVWNGEEFAACTGKSLLRLSDDGTVVQTAAMQQVARCSLVWTGAQYVVVWAETQLCFPVCDPPTAVRAQVFTRDLTPLGLPVMLTNPDASGDPKAVASGDRVLVVWLERKGNELWLTARRLTGSGLVLDPVALTIARASFLSDVVAEGDHWVVVSGAEAWTVTRDGEVRERETRHPFVAAGADVDIVAGGPVAVALFQATDPVTLMPEIYVRFLESVRRRAVRP